MFRIKTDIRQFNCETRQKVEKLIRSWVIRPTDLILDEAAQSWSPIGELEEFAPLFSELREASDVAALSEPSAPSDEKHHGVITLRALRDEGGALKSSPLPRPHAPEGVEGVAQSDELTMMTERTADLLGVLDEVPAQLEPLPMPSAPEGVEIAAPSGEEPTGIYLREEGEGEEGEAEYSLEEHEAPSADLDSARGRHDLPEELFLTNEISRIELISPLEPMTDELADAGGLPERDPEAWEVTRQIELPWSDPEAQDHDEPNESIAIDAHGALRSEEEGESERDEPALDLPSGLDLEQGGLDVALSEAAEGDIHSEWENMMELDELRETDEFSVGALASASPGDEDEALKPFPWSVDPSPPPSLQQDEQSEPRAFEELSEAPAEETYEAPPEENTRAHAASEVQDDTLEIDAEAAREAERAEASTEEIPLEPLRDADTAPQTVLAPDAEEFISEGYALPLPFAIEPDSAALRRGLRRSTASTQDKDRAFPPPRPKRPGELTHRTYEYGASSASRSSSSSASSSPPRDYSRIVAFIALMLIALVIASLIIIFN